MNIGIIGGGSVGQTLGAALAARGHAVVIGIRNPSGEELAKPRAQADTLEAWLARTGSRVSDIPTAAAGAELVINATKGDGSIAAIRAAGHGLDGKVLIDVANPLDFSRGMPPFLMAEYAGPTSLAEQIQAVVPGARVVKAFNTVAAAVMVNPGLIPGPHDLFMAGNDTIAKETVSGIARSFGWTEIVDLGDLAGARATESLLPIWVRLWMTGGSPLVNLHVTRG
jgi:8-hydroxy-5-deazaflavin:NADPH oxidoreductase